MTFKNWIVDLFKDERGSTSIKPVIAFLGSTFLCGTMLANSFSHGDIKPSEDLVNAVMIITAIGMGADTLDKFSYILTVLFFLLLGLNNLNAQSLVVDTVINNIKIGPFTENKNLAFGVKNIAEEIINEQDKFYLVGDKSTSEYKIKIELIFFDIIKVNSGISVFHQDKTTTVIRMKGILYKGDKKIKQEFSEGKSTEISTSTIIIDEGGKFNQQSASSAIKKTTQTLLNNLLL
jgi:hypothetical protein